MFVECNGAMQRACSAVSRIDINDSGPDTAGGHAGENPHRAPELLQHRGTHTRQLDELSSEVGGIGETGFQGGMGEWRTSENHLERRMYPLVKYVLAQREAQLLLEQVKEAIAREVHLTREVRQGDMLRKTFLNLLQYGQQSLIDPPCIAFQPRQIIDEFLENCKHPCT